MLKVCLNPVPTLSPAMRRIAHALSIYAPEWARVVPSPEHADVQLLHAVGLDVRRHRKAKHYAVLMHALDFQQDPKGTGANLPINAPGMQPWEAVWRDALVVWTYYLGAASRYRWSSVATVEHDGSVGRIDDGSRGPRLLEAPLGVDSRTFTLPPAGTPRPVGVVTTGHVSGPQAEAIEEVALAAHACGMRTVHVGPSEVGGMSARVPGWTAVSDVPDSELAGLYGRSQWVSGLRHGEGFELPVLEGALCGARPICFDTPNYRHWFGDVAAFVPETSGDALVEALTGVLSRAPQPLTERERDAVAARFDWEAIANLFWRELERACASKPDLAPLMKAAPSATVTVSAQKRRIIWVGDSPTNDWTGFGRASRHIVRRLLPDYEVHVIGTTHDGAPYDRAEFPYDVWPVSKPLGDLVTEVRPDVVVMQHDPWIIQSWLKQVGDAPAIGVMPIDGLNCRCEGVNQLALAVWWTKFAEHEARRGGYVGPSTVIPLGVDLETYHPIDRAEARKVVGFPAAVRDAFIVGVVARNQPRKRLDLTVRHFCEWVKTHDVRDAYLYVQAAPTGECAYDIGSLMEYEGLVNRLILFEPKLRRPVAESAMARIYSALNVYFTTTQGEGWGLPVMEAMACGVPVVAPNWSGLGDWAEGAAHLVRCDETAATINPMAPVSGVRIGVIGGVPSREENVAALHRIYQSDAYRQCLTALGLAKVHEPQYRWEAIGDAFAEAIGGVIHRKAMRPALAEAVR